MLRRACLSAAIVLLSATAALAGSGPYLGFHGGASGIDLTFGQERVRLESTEFAWKAFGGVGLGRFLAIETGYVSLGTAKEVEAILPLEQKLWGWDTAALVKINLGPVDLYGRVGGIYWKSTVTVGSTSLELKDDGFDVNYGGGLGVNLGKLAIRGEMVWYDVSSVGSPWMASAGITLGF